MAIPFCIEFPLVEPSVRTHQAITILAITVTFFGADLLAERARAASSSIIASRSTPSKRALAIAALLIFLLTAGLLIVTVPSIPILAELRQDAVSPAALLDMRNSFSRYLDVPPLLKYWFNAAPFVIGAPAALLFGLSGAPILAGISLCTVAIYSLLRSAKVPFVVVFCMFCLGIVNNTPERSRLTTLRAAILVTTLVLTGMATTA